MSQGNVDPNFGAARATLARAGSFTYAFDTSTSAIVIDLDALGMSNKWIDIKAETEGIGYLFRAAGGSEVPVLAARDVTNAAGAVTARGTGVCGTVEAGETRSGYVHDAFPVLVVLAGAAGVVRLHNSQANKDD